MTDFKRYNFAGWLRDMQLRAIVQKARVTKVRVARSALQYIHPFDINRPLEGTMVEIHPDGWNPDRPLKPKKRRG
jgi:hypothetical protein